MKSKDATIFASIWHRNKMAIYSKTIENANKLLFKLKLYIPQYRQLIICGDFPKEARYITGAKLLENQELESLREAFIDSLNEEEMGAPPVQIVFFNADKGEFKNILSCLDRGWIVTTTCKKEILEKESFPIKFKIHEELTFDEGVVHILDPIPENTYPEERILEDTQGCGKGIREFMIQMKENQVHLAFQAIQDELENKKHVTQSYISESLNIREKTLRKIIEIGKLERRLDISKYIENTPPQIVNLLTDISNFKELSLAAVFDEGNLIGYGKYRDVSFPSQNFLKLKEKIDILSDDEIGIGDHWYTEVNTQSKHVLLFKHHFLYGFVMEKGINPTVFKFQIEKIIKNYLH